MVAQSYPHKILLFPAVLLLADCFSVIVWTAVTAVEGLGVQAVFWALYVLPCLPRRPCAGTVVIPILQMEKLRCTEGLEKLAEPLNIPVVYTGVCVLILFTFFSVLGFLLF